MEGLVLFNKPEGKTSYEIVEYFKKLTKKRVGHGGILDPFAEGLLILGIGEYTKELQKFLKESIKTYIAEIELGKISSTYDREGEIKLVNKFSPNQPIFIPNKSKLEEILQSFIGEIEQIPPPFSAVKIKGRPAYEYARKGEKVNLKPRKIKIYEIKILEYNFPILKIETTVNSGTYIRTLANDIGEKTGFGGYLKNLFRIKINDYELKHALTFEDIEKKFLEFLAKIYGRVQGVGFRFFAESYANDLNIKGYVKNLIDGTVEVLAQGIEENLQKFILKLKQGPRLAKVEKIDILFRKPLKIYSDFKITF